MNKTEKINFLKQQKKKISQYSGNDSQFGIIYARENNRLQIKYVKVSKISHKIKFY